TPTGMIPTKQMLDDVPVSVSEIVEDVCRAAEIGISMVHLHARDDDGRPTYQEKIYGEIISKIRESHPELVICVSLSGRDYSEFEKRAAPLMLEGDSKPDMGSLTLSSLNFPKSGSANSPDIIRQLAEAMNERGIVPELEVFDLGMMNYSHYLIKKGLLTAPHYVNIILGNIATAQMDLIHAGLLLRDMPSDCLWSLGGIGANQLAANTIAIAMGGGVRIGLEDNIYWDPQRTQTATNSMFLNRIQEIAAQFSRAVMPPSELRKKLGLNPGNGSYGRGADVSCQPDQTAHAHA
ncbi:MAG: 3-keto-5-aminohexanoate cleavage protein, partial [Verrucomicrobiales bacterium]